MKSKASFLSGIILLGVLSGLIGGCSTFNDGIVAIAGKGGTIARSDAMPSTIAMAEKLQPHHPTPHWQGEFPYEAADLIAFIDDDRVLVGSLEVGGYLGVPDLKSFILYDTKSGKQLWSADRPALYRGQYSLLATQPHILVQGGDKKSLHLIAIDRDSGAELWHHQAEAPYKTTTASGFLALLSVVDPDTKEDNTYKISMFDPKNGQLQWEQELQSGVIDEEAHFELLSNGSHLIVAADELVVFDTKTGNRVWLAQEQILSTTERSLLVTSQGLLIYNAHDVALYNLKTGELRWHKTMIEGDTRLITELDNYLIRIAHGSGKGDLIQRLENRNGKTIWLHDTDEQVVSPVALEQQRLIYSTEKALVALDPHSGKRHYRTILPKPVRLGSPTYTDPSLGQPDLFYSRRGKLFLSREQYGVIAFEPKTGKIHWQQPVYETLPGTWPYSVAARTEFLNLSLMAYQPKASANKATSSLSLSTERQQSAFLRHAQSNYNQAKQYGSTSDRHFAVEQLSN